jgi:hypothetical protein
VYPTPFYSIAGNVVIGLGLARLRVLGAPDVLILGVYLILSGLARFVEEGYRGEPQTPRVLGLPIYQWLAVLSLAAGIAVTAFGAPPESVAGSAVVGFSAPSSGHAAAALLMFVLTGAAMGVDLPASNRRFSRLAPGD